MTVKDDFNTLVDEIRTRTGAFCAGCGHAFGEGAPPTPCPVCGSESRHVYAHARASLGATATMRSLARYKEKRPGAKPALEVVRGDDFHHETGEWRRIEQVVDRTVTPARYRKRVIRPDGTVVRDVDELLANHQGYGAAKP